MATPDARRSADVRPWTIKMPDQEELGNLVADLRYSALIDSVFVYFYSADLPAVNVVMDDNITALIDPDSNKMLGLEIDHFLSEAVLANPGLEPLLDLPGMPARRVKQIRQQLDPARRRKLAIGTLIEQITRRDGGESGPRLAVPQI